VNETRSLTMTSLRINDVYHCDVDNDELRPVEKSNAIKNNNQPRATTMLAS